MISSDTTRDSSRLPTRRHVLHLAGALAASAVALPRISQAKNAEVPSLLVPATAPSSQPADPWHGLKIGLASYSCRKLTLEQTNFKSVESRDGHNGGWSQCLDKLGELLAETKAGTK